MEKNRDIRIRFTKKGNIRFISHLDLTRVFTRALRRAGIELKVSSGFTPHPKISFALPLSVGMESECEICDITLIEELTIDEILERLAPQLPAGITLIGAEPALGKLSDIRYASYEILLPECPLEAIKDIDEILKGELVVEKRSKAGIKKTDISGSILKHSVFEKDGGVCISVILPAGGGDYLNPEYVYTAVKDSLKPCFDAGSKKIVRKQCFRI